MNMIFFGDDHSFDLSVNDVKEGLREKGFCASNTSYFGTRALYLGGQNPSILWPKIHEYLKEKNAFLFIYTGEIAKDYLAARGCLQKAECVIDAFDKEINRWRNK